MCTRAVMPSQMDRCRCFPYAQKLCFSRGGEAKLQAKMVLDDYLHIFRCCVVGIGLYNIIYGA
jgi:hypothetical protein